MIMCLRNISLCDEQNSVFNSFSILMMSIVAFYVVLLFCLLFFIVHCAHHIFADKIPNHVFLFFSL